MSEQLTKARTVEMIAAEINALTAQMLSSVIEIGRRMVEAKEMLPYGSFGAWIEENTGYSSSTANNFMRLYQEYGAAQGSLFGASVESQTIGKLSYSKALALLALPADEREIFAEENHVEDMTTRQLQQAIKERDQARMGQETAQAEADQARAEKDKMASEAAVLKSRIDALQEEARRSETELEALENARKEGAAKAKKKLEAAQRALEEAEGKLKAMEEQAQSAQREAERLRKIASAAGDKDISRFGLLFDQTQGLVRQMADIAGKLEAEGRTADCEKLRKALGALASAVEKASKVE